MWSVEGYYLPFWYGRLRLHRGLTPHMFCHIRITQSEATTGETLSCDIDVYSDQGELLAQIENYIMKRIHDPDTVRQQTELAAQAPDGGAAAPGRSRRWPC
ncbi:MAG: polyketide synthase dehydratase domain-containing protein [Tessaracoccus sp.]